MDSNIKLISENTDGVFSKNPNITFHVVTEPLRKAALDCECKAFGNAKFVYNEIFGVDEKEHLKIFESILNSPDNDLVSTCAVDNISKQVVCGMRNEPYPPNGIHVYPVLPDGSIHPYVGNLSVLDAEWPKLFAKMGLEPNEKEFLYFFMGYTDPKYFNQGIYSELYQFTERVAKSKGYKYIFGLLMSKAMQAVMTRKFGYSNLLEMGFDEVRVNGEFPMKKFIEEHPEYQSDTIMFAFKKI